MAELIGRGPVVLDLLCAAFKDDDLEIARCAEKCAVRIQEEDVAVDVAPAAVRLLTAGKTAGAVETMFAYLPFADNDSVADETRTLGFAPWPVRRANRILPSLPGWKTRCRRRAAAGEALAADDQKPAVRKLLQMRAFVRLRIALPGRRKETEASPVLIESCRSSVNAGLASGRVSTDSARAVPACRVSGHRRGRPQEMSRCLARLVAEEGKVDLASSGNAEAARLHAGGPAR